MQSRKTLLRFSLHRLNFKSCLVPQIEEQCIDLLRIDDPKKLLPASESCMQAQCTFYLSKYQTIQGEDRIHFFRQYMAYISLH